MCTFPLLHLTHFITLDFFFYSLTSWNWVLQRWGLYSQYLIKYWHRVDVQWVFAKCWKKQWKDRGWGVTLKRAKQTEKVFLSVMLKYVTHECLRNLGWKMSKARGSKRQLILEMYRMETICMNLCNGAPGDVALWISSFLLFSKLKHMHHCHYILLAEGEKMVNANFSLLTGSAHCTEKRILAQRNLRGHLLQYLIQWNYFSYSILDILFK